MQVRQIEDILLDATEEVRLERVLDFLDAVLGDLSVPGAQLGHVELARVERVKEPEQLVKVVVDRGAAEQQAEATADGEDVPEQLALVAALESLTLIDDDAFPSDDLLERGRL